MKSSFFLLITGVLTVAFFLFSPQQKSRGVEIYAEKEGELLLPQKNVAIAVLSLSDVGLDFTNPEDIIRLGVLQDDFILLKGVTKIESILNVSRVISEGDDIVVSRVIPADTLLLTEAYLKNLSGEIPEFPELSPYISSDLSTALFYIYYSNNSDSRGIHRDLKILQKKWKDKIPFDFTGRAPIIAETESLLTIGFICFFQGLFNASKALNDKPYKYLLSIPFLK